MEREFEPPKPEDIETEIEAVNERIDQDEANRAADDGADYCTLQYIPEERYRPRNWDNSSLS